jgi:protein phosphatase
VSDVGRQRKRNEDAALVLETENVYAVADGMGGHQGGAIASQLAVEAITTTFLGAPRSGVIPRVPPEAAMLVQSISAANESIRYLATRNANLAEMGTTVVAAMFRPECGRLYVAHVGDSRCYRWRDGVLEQLTRDHTVRAMDSKGGMVERLNRAVGPCGVVDVDLAVHVTRPGDKYLLCSDGISKMLSKDEIREALASGDSPQARARDLVERANAAGGKDNITALVVSVNSKGQAA